MNVKGFFNALQMDSNINLRKPQIKKLTGNFPPQGMQVFG